MGSRAFSLKLRPNLTQKWTVGVDIGTSRTCISFSLTPNPEDAAVQLVICTVPPRDSRAKRELKTKTAIALDAEAPHGIVAFGCEAEDKYVDAMLEAQEAGGEEEGEEVKEQQEEEDGGKPPAVRGEGRRRRVVLFSEFKMELAPGARPRRASFESVLVRSQCGTVEVPLLLLFIRTLEHIARTALEEVGTRTAGHGDTPLTAHDLHWCLTVPAGWDDDAKAFMRRAALQAGLIPHENSTNLSFCYEPEGAFLGIVNDQPDLLLDAMGSRVMVVDGGAGTVDISVHELRSVHPLELPQVMERVMSTTLGSAAIDRRFEQWMLRDLLGLDEEEAAERVRRSVQWRQNVMRQFEEVKVYYNEASNQCFRLDLHYLIAEQLPANFSLQERAALQEGCRASGTSRLTLSRKVISRLFEPVVKDVAALVKATHARAGGAKACPRVLMAGGFGESRLLIEEVRHVVPPGVEVVAGLRPSVAIARGSIVHALTHSVPTRVLAKTVSLQVDREYEPGDPQHEAAVARGASEVVGGKRFVKLFKELVSRGEEVSVPTYSRRQGPYWPLSEAQTEARFRFMVTDGVAAGVEGGGGEQAEEQGEEAALVGSVAVPLDMERACKDERAFYVTLVFGDTEMKAIISDRAGDEVRKQLSIAYE